MVQNHEDSTSEGRYHVREKQMSRNRMMPTNRTIDVDALRMLFEAYRDNNDELFQHAAQALIGRELSANHHDEAQKLIRALGRPAGDRVDRPRLARLPQRGLTGTDLVTIIDDPKPDRDPVFAFDTSERLGRLIREHREHARLAAHGLSPKQKILFWGPPGCGKTLAASVIARELQMPLGILNLPSIVSSLLGGTSAQLKSVFDLAASRRIVILLDEFDTLAKERDDDRDIGESKRIVNSLLQLMERFSSSRSIILAATNHQHNLDQAVWRRFDDVIPFPLPTEQQRRELLRHLTSGVHITGSLLAASKATKGLSHAEIGRAVEEELRTMVLEGRRHLAVDAVLQEVLRYNRVMRGAHSKRVPLHRVKEGPSKPVA